MAAWPRNGVGFGKFEVVAGCGICALFVYYYCMITGKAYNTNWEANVIRSFGDKRTEALFHGKSSRGVLRLAPDLLKAAFRKLDMLNAAMNLQDLRSPPGNRLEALKGNLAGRHSIRVNDQWRLVFRWKQDAAWDVTLMD